MEKVVRGKSHLIFALALLGLMVLTGVPLSFAGSPLVGKLHFKGDHTFKIVQFTDTQDDQDCDPRTISLINTVLDDQKPDLVVFTGDNIRGGPTTVDELKKAIDSVVSPVDSRAIPWLVTFGNHDHEATDPLGLTKVDQLQIYMSYPYNINKKTSTGTYVGNMNVLIYSSKGATPMFNVWALDSGEYASETIGGQSIGDDGLPGWDWMRYKSIQWYTSTSEALQVANGKRIPSLMFFHIPLWEYSLMWNNKDRHSVVGERNETECPGPFNTGLFAAVLQRGDVKGIFVGHDHVNDYVGNYFGVTLGYSANTGFGTYGLGGTDNDRLRGARVFNLKETAPNKFTTKMVFAKDYNIQ